MNLHSKILTFWVMPWLVGGFLLGLWHGQTVYNIQQQALDQTLASATTHCRPLAADCHALSLPTQATGLYTDTCKSLPADLLLTHFRREAAHFTVETSQGPWRLVRVVIEELPRIACGALTPLVDRAAHQRHLTWLGGLSMGLLVLLGGHLWLRHHFDARLWQLRQMLSRLKHYRATTPLNFSGRDELTTLARGLDDLNLRIHQGRERELRLRRALSRSRRRYHDLYHNAPDAFLNLDVTIGRIGGGNLTLAKLLGGERKRLVGRCFADWLLPASHGVLRNALHHCDRSGSAIGGVELWLRDAQGHTRIVSLNATGPVTRGNQRYCRATLRDITARKQMEERLILRERCLEAASNGIVIADHRQPDDPIIYCNAAFERMTGYSRNEVVGRNCRFLQTPDAVNTDARRRIRDTLQRGTSCRVLLVNQRRNGETFWNELVLSPVTDDGVITHYIGIQSDVTQAKAAEQALQTARDRWQRYVQLAQVALLVLDRQGRVQFVNEWTCRLLGYEETALLGRDWLTQCVPAIHQQRITNRLQALLAGALVEPDYFENLVVTRGGEPRLMAWRSAVLRNEQGEVIGSLSSGEDVTERRRLEEQLRQREEEWHLTFQYAPLGMAVVDLKGYWQRVNHAFCTALGYSESEMRRLHFNQVTDEADRADSAALFARLVNGEIKAYQQHKRYRHRNGAVVHAMLRAGLVHDSAGAPAMVVSLMEDRTAQIKAETEAAAHRERLAHMTRVHTMGEMASGIAHETSQPLTAINTYAQACRRLIASGQLQPDEFLDVLDKISVQAQRAGAVISRLRGFVRRGDGGFERRNLNALAKESVNLFLTGGERFSVKITYSPTPLAVRVDPIQVQQVMLNFLRNATEAMVEAGQPQGTIEIVIEAEGHRARVSVRDHGTGLPAGGLEALLEPFFTTKGDGMGLGLPISRSIIEAHQGQLGAYNHRDGGAVFFFTLPLAQHAAPPNPPWSQHAKALPVPAAASATDPPK